MEARAGTRVRCASCGSELIVVKVQHADDAELSCCGQPVQPITKDGSPPDRQP